MSELMTRPVRVRDVLAATTSKARALEDPTRAALLDMMLERPMSVQEMVEELRERGIDKAPTTVRHHVDILKEAGLLDLTRLDQGARGVVKYYAATARFLDYEEPEGFEERLAEAIGTSTREVSKLLKALRKRHGKEVRAAAESLRDCEYCNTQHFEEYVLVRLVQAGLARAMHPQGGVAGT